jgi:hypothetical protein
VCLARSTPERVANLFWRRHDVDTQQPGGTSAFQGGRLRLDRIGADGIDRARTSVRAIHVDMGGDRSLAHHGSSKQRCDPPGAAARSFGSHNITFVRASTRVN